MRVARHAASNTQCDAVVTKALYGLRQASREFEDHRDHQLRLLDYKNLNVAPSFFFRRLADRNSPYGSTIDIGSLWSDDLFGGFDNYDKRRANDCVAEIGSVLEIEDKG